LTNKLNPKEYLTSGRIIIEVIDGIFLQNQKEITLIFEKMIVIEVENSRKTIRLYFLLQKKKHFNM